MFLLAKPPVARWVLVGVALCIAVWADMRPPATVPHPHAIEDLEAGTEIGEAQIEWIRVAVGVLDPVEIPGVATRPIRAGDPLLSGDVDGDRLPVPDGWWRVELEVPANTSLGDQVVVVLTSDMESGATTFEGMIASTPDDDGFGRVTAICAFPKDAAVAVATAIETGRAVTLVR